MPTRFGLLIISLFLAWIPAFGDTITPIDPRIKVGHGTGSDPVGLDFTVKVVGGGGISDFFNDTSFTWTGLEFIGRSKVPQAVTCVTDPLLFSTCSVSSIQISNKMFQVTVDYFNGEILPGEHFFVDLRGDSKHTWQSPFLDAHASVPEPSVTSLLIFGVVVLLGGTLVNFRTKRRQMA